MSGGFSKSIGRGICLFLVVMLSQVNAAITVILSVAAPQDTSITGNEQIAVESFIQSNVNQQSKGAQVGMFCTLSTGSTTLTVITNGVVLNASSTGGIEAFCPTGIPVVDQAECSSGVYWASGMPLCEMQVGLLYYLGTITYDVSDCASDSIEVHADPLGVADGSPMADDETRVRDATAGSGNLIPIVSELFATLVPDLGTCCNGLSCLGGGMNRYCCEQGLYGGPPGEFHTFSNSCADPTPCTCTADAQCDDGQFCNGVETCNLGTGSCVNGTPPTCPTGADAQCTTGVCNPAVNGGAGACTVVNLANGTSCSIGTEGVSPCDAADSCLNGVCQENRQPIGTACGSAVDTDCDNPDTCNATGTCSINHETNGTACISDGDSCTADVCASGFCAHNPSPNGTACDDGVFCTVNEVCVEGTCSSSPRDCADALDCTLDTCDAQSDSCIHTDINSITCAIQADCPGTSPCGGNGFCTCVEQPDLTLEPRKDANGANCHEDGETVFVDIFFGGSLPNQCIAGGQFRVEYDETCLDFFDAIPGQFPWTIEEYQQVNETTGVVFYIVTAPNDGMGGQLCDSDPGVMATLKFHKLPGCDACNLCLTQGNPDTTHLTTDNGTPVFPEQLGCTKDIHGAREIVLTCPSNTTVNADCGAVTAMVEWPVVNAVDTCDGPLGLDCSCSYSGPFAPFNCDNLILTGGEFPKGTYSFQCELQQSSDNICNLPDMCAWTVTVNNQHTLDALVQLSPIVEGTSCTRCICFEIFESCAPVVFTEVCQTMSFGDAFNFPGQAHQDIDIPAGKPVCITARDRQHSLRASYTLGGTILCDGINVKAEFKTDPLFGGNWLVQGNLNRDRVIDILDYGVFIAQLNQNPTPNPKTCADNNGNGLTHADFNCDGIVDAADFTFIQINFFEDDQDICCPGQDASGGGTPGLTEVSVKDLREMGLEELLIADLNNDGVLNLDDMAAYLNGARPASNKEEPRRGARRAASVRE